MRIIIEHAEKIRSHKETKGDLLKLADAARTLAMATIPATEFMDAYAASHGLSLDSQKLTCLAAYLERLSSKLQVPKGARRAPRAKLDAVVAAANVLREVVPGCAQLQNAALLKEVGESRFRGLAEVMYEAIAGVTDGVGKLDHQIRLYRLDRLYG